MKKYKINIMDTPEEKDISKYMNFDKVVSKYKIVTLWKKFVIGTISTGGLALTITTVIYFTGNKHEIQQGNKDNIIEIQNHITEFESGSLKSAQIAENEEIPEITQSNISDSSNQTSKGISSVKSNNSKESARILNSIEPKTIEVTEEGQSFNYSFRKASPIIGFDSLYRYLQDNLVFQQNTIEQSGTIVISFSIDTLGRPTKIIIQEGLSEDFNNEAKRIISDMPDWSPAELNGKPVETRLSIPVYVELVKNKTQE